MSRDWPIFVIFTLSGAAGLIYEIVWSRQLILVFGNTTQAISAILTGFFGGMVIGSALGGRIADRINRPLRMYALLEVTLVAVVLLTPASFLLMQDIYRGVFDVLVASPRLLALVRFGLSLLALGPATILMGATLPALTRYLSRGASLSIEFSRLYGANTVGAILGTMAAGFVLIELFGLSGALYVGATCSAIAGIAALLMDWLHSPVGGTVKTDSLPGMRSTAQTNIIASGVNQRPRKRLALVVAFVSGLTSLGYQTLWTRVLSSGTGNSTYVFTTILAIFLCGLALGTAAFTILRVYVRTIALLAIGEIISACLALIGVVALIVLGTGGILSLPIASLIVVLPATSVMGVIFPASSALIADSEGHVGANSGLLLSANTLGSIFGAFLIPFVVIPLIGSPAAIGLIALLNAGVGIALALTGRIKTPNVRRLVTAAGAGTAIILVLALMLGDIFVDPNMARIYAARGSVAMSLEDEIASVQAGEVGGFQQLWVNGTSMTLKTVDVKLMPILPLILRPESKTDLTIGFGMGSAYRAALIAGLKTTVVELVPSVPKTFDYFYADAQQVLSNPNGHIVIADGRNYVELTNQHYDIIVVDPAPPIYSSGVSVISSREFYAAAKARLTPTGVMMQWIPYGETLFGFKAQLRTFHSVFPHMIVVFGPGGNGLYMLGSREPIAFESTAIRQVLSRPGVVDDLSSSFDSPQHDASGWAAFIPTLIWIQGDRVTMFTGVGPLVTDDHPLPEYFLLRRLFGPKSLLASRRLMQSLTPSR